MRIIMGWLGVAVTVIFTNVWTYWGIIENFHEGWYSDHEAVEHCRD
jgi:hypothetical protein